MLSTVLGCIGVLRGMLSVAEASEDVYFQRAVAKVAAQIKSESVARDGLAMLTQVAVGVSDAVPGMGLPFAVVRQLA